MSYCCVPSCKSYKHCFPVDNNSRNEWIVNVRRDMETYFKVQQHLSWIRLPGISWNCPQYRNVSFLTPSDNVSKDSQSVYVVEGNWISGECVSLCVNLHFIVVTCIQTGAESLTHCFLYLPPQLIKSQQPSDRSRTDDWVSSALLSNLKQILHTV